MPKPSSDEWAELQRLSQQSPKDDGFLTKREIATQLGKSTHYAANLIRLASEAGVLETRRIMRTNIMGDQQAVAAYRVKAKKTPAPPSRR